MSAHEEDAALVAHILSGREGSFDRFVDLYCLRLFRFALRRLGGSRAAAEDAAQATILRAIDALPTYRGEASLLTLMFTLRRQRATDVRLLRAITS